MIIIDHKGKMASVILGVIEEDVAFAMERWFE
jgi:hypothetical protein